MLESEANIRVQLFNLGRSSSVAHAVSLQRLVNTSRFESGYYMTA